MNCQEAIQRLIKLLGDLLQHFNHPLSDKDIGNIIEEVEKLISYIKNNCIKQIDIDLLNRLEFFLRVVKHFFNIRRSVDEGIIRIDNLEEFLNREISELIEKLKNI